MNYTAKQVQEIALNMKAYGGSFMKNIGAALTVADQDNTKKILNTWPDECAKYLKFSEQ